MSGVREAFRITMEREREISARIAEAVSQQRILIGDTDGANVAREIARLIRGNDLPEIREAFLQELRQRSESVLSKGLLGQSPSHLEQDTAQTLKEIDPSWSGKKPASHEPIEVRTRSGLRPVQLVLKRRHME